MPDLTAEQLAHLTQHAAAFVQSVQRTATQKQELSVITRLTDFPEGDMFTVYAGLLFARSKKVAVTFLP
jgi:hypothetical protein